MPEETSQNASPNRLLDAVVVGAGQAGLAIAWHLQRQGLRFTVLEAGSELGHTWRDRWDSLKLFTPAQYDGLPGMPFPAPADTYPTKDPVADYLQTYVTAFDLPVRLNARVTSLTRTNDGFQVRTADDTLQTRQVVVATGPFQVPFIPPAAEGLEPSVTQVHGADYRNPEGLPGGPVLVVGGGNSGLQIAEELAATRQVDLSIGERAPMLPQRLAGRDLFWWLTRLGLLRVTADSRLGRRASRREFIIGTNKRRLRKAGVRFRPRLVEADGRTVRFADGSALHGVGVVVWATGYPFRLHLDPHPRCNRAGAGGTPTRPDQHPGSVLPGIVLAAHPRLGPAWLRQQRCHIPSRPDRRPPPRRRISQRFTGEGRPIAKLGTAGLPGLTPHELRHTAASLAVVASTNVMAVQQTLGHASAAVTFDV